MVVVVVVGNVYFSIEALTNSKKKYALNFKKTLKFNQQIRFKFSVFLAISLFNQWYLFGHVVRASPRGWSSKSFAGGNGKTCSRMEKTKRTPMNILDLKRDERPCATEYLPSLGFQKGTRQNWLASFCSHDHVLALDLPVMMTMMIFMIAHIV